MITKQLKTDSSEEDILDAFRNFDQNGDGFISTDEIRNVLETANLEEIAADDVALNTIKDGDVDDDGLISFPEFLALMTS